MNFAETFIRRPVATTLLVLTILIFGIMGYFRLPVADLPTVDYPTIQVNANLPGANPDTMASSVATPLEKSFATISGITSISSRSSQGSTNISLTFDLDRNIDSAAQDVQTAIARSSRGLPPGMPTPPSYNKSNPSDMPVLFLTLSSETLPLAQVDRYAETVLAQRLSMVTGVAQVNVFGAQKFAVRVDLDPTQLAARQIGIDQVTQAINGSNVNRPTGTLFGPNRNFVVQSSGQLMSAEQFRPIVVAYRNGNPVRLEEVARVYDGVENPRNGSWYNGKPALYLGIQRQPGTNTVEVVDAVKALLPELQAAARRHPDEHPQRSLGVHPRVGARRQVHAGADRRPGRPGHLRVPPEPVRDHHPQPGAAVLDRRHVRGHVGAQLQPRQPVADGAHAVGRLRRRRRHRHAGEHRPAHGDGEAAHAGGARRLEGDRLHDHLDDGVARRRVHPDPVHGAASSAA